MLPPGYSGCAGAIDTPMLGPPFELKSCGAAVNSKALGGFPIEMKAEIGYLIIFVILILKGKIKKSEIIII